MDKKIDYKKLRDSRVDKDLKQKEIAAKLNITSSAYSRIERGERGLRVEQLKVIADMFGKNIKEFFKEKENSTNANSSNIQEIMKTEIEPLEKIFCMVSTEIEQNVLEVFRKYDSKYP